MTAVIKRDETLLQVRRLAVTAGRNRQSEQTGFVHIGDTIPVVENVLFALALLRSRTADAVMEGRDILKKILRFQCPNGNFPTYLHQYPETEDYFLAAELLAPFQIILQEFGQVLGSLESDLSNSLRLCLDHLEKQECKPNTPQRLKMDAAFGRSFEADVISPQILGDLFVAQQMVGDPLESAPWSVEACCYNGPGLRERQEGFEPEVTLFDLFMGCRTGVLSARMLRDHPVHLYGALINAIEEDVEPICHEEAVSCEEAAEHMRRWQYLYKKVWGAPERCHSLVCQGGNIRSWTFEDSAFHFQLGQPIVDEPREKMREVCFFLDRQPLKILVNGVESTTFSLGDELRLVTDEKTIVLKFELEDGEGIFMGHVMLGNRPAQISNERYEAFDWQIFLRTIGRSERCSVRVSLQFYAS